MRPHPTAGTYLAAFVTRLASVCLARSDETSASEDGSWFCSHSMTWDECKKYLPAERDALTRFMKALGETAIPRHFDLGGRGIVMSGGQSHVLQALANLRVLRKFDCGLPVEFWHAFELDPVHCEALAELGATCRTLQVPGVYPHWQTVVPAILSSSFSEFIWMDTDVTPLMDLELVFDTGAYSRDGALFWPDLWGMGCDHFGQTAWPRHVAWHLLGIEHNVSDYRCTHEHEAGHLVVNKIRHWRALCLANYLSSRDFFAQVLWGYKDVFRFAWLKLNASNWLSPVRPGLVGSFLKDGRFFGTSLIHWWPADDEFMSAHSGSPIPLYVHQKKLPGTTWSEIISFREPLGECPPYAGVPVNPSIVGAEVWALMDHHKDLLWRLEVAELIWNNGYSDSQSRFEADPRLTADDINRLHPQRNKVATDQWTQSVYACQCEYTDNRWFQIASFMTSGRPTQMLFHLLECHLGFEPEDASEGVSSLDVCAIGHVARAFVCSQLHQRQGAVRQAVEAATALKRILPRVKQCLRFSFWPMEFEKLLEFVNNMTGLESNERLGLAREQEEGTAERLQFQGTVTVPHDRLRNFPARIRRCFPLKDPLCWEHLPRSSIESVPAAAIGDSMAASVRGARVGGVEPQTSCLFCCDPHIPWRASCFDEVYTEERCCSVDQN
eukprot:TRINITY_DN55372_c0_g1_i1.p1 TRINITY_DN55372_c0_g1~~TRINITY_DN55372_c0_g1_i1.p1  ORF type:complete len:667 (+),score=67.72 TRINITY_DN55372_c0_g1_i1:88-2088(+)